MRANPHILEISAHSWLKKIGDEIGVNNLTLDNVPESYLFTIKESGFDALWLMGVWEESPASREIARADRAINEQIGKVFPDYKKEDIIGSQYSIHSYNVSSKLGGDAALLKFKEKLNEFGVILILDFAANHLAKDHPLTLSNPDLFIKSKGEPEDKSLYFKTENGDWLAHGRDPHFPPWTDTVQLNHFNPDTRKYLMDTLMHVSSLCDGLRCDMVMLMINKVFRDFWGDVCVFDAPADEFWPTAIRKVKEKYPFFIFTAEVYWGLEWDVQEMGFDYTYDKILYDRLLKSSPQDIQGHLTAEHLYQMRSTRFISNHDEEAPIKAFGREKSKAAAVVVSTIPGARLFTFEQIYGLPAKLPIQYIPSLSNKDEEMFEFYSKLLTIVNHPCFHGGQWVMKKTRPVIEEDETCSNILSWVWTQLSTIKIVAVNYSDTHVQCLLPVDKVPPQETIFIKEEFSDMALHMNTADAKKKGILLDLKPYECKIFSVDF